MCQRVTRQGRVKFAFRQQFRQQPASNAITETNTSTSHIVFETKSHPL